MPKLNNIIVPLEEGILPLQRLNSEVSGITNHVSNISTIVGNHLEKGQLTVAPETLSSLTNKFSTVVFDVSSIMPRLNSFESIVNTPSSILLDNQKSNFLTSDLVVNSTASILSSTASMVGTIRSATEQLCITDQGQIQGLHSRDFLTPHSLDSPISIDSFSQDNVLKLGDRLESNISTISALMDTSMATSRLNAEIYAQPPDVASPFLSNENQSFTTLNSLSSRIYEDLLTFPSLDTNSFLFQAPTIEPYSAARATAILAGVDERTLNQLAVINTDELLDELGGELYSRLQTLNPELAEVYKEGIAAMESGHHGWIRHAGVSFRTLFDHLLRHLAPDQELRSFFEDPENHMTNGEFKRNARLLYIFKDVATGSYAKMAEQDIKLAEGIFFPSNDIVHRLTSPLSDKQMHVFWRRIQGSVSVVLAAAGI